MIPSRQNTTEPKGQLEFAVFMMERAIDLMGPGVESVPSPLPILRFLMSNTRTLDLLINFADRAKNPALGTARDVSHLISLTIT